MEEWNLIISGRVQGVFYRASVLKFVQNERLSVKGFVRNMNDGRVQVIVQGEITALEKLLGFCRQGPPMANVDDIQIIKSTGAESLPDFYIQY
jgi:acylphosphatase